MNFKLDFLHHHNYQIIIMHWDQMWYMLPNRQCGSARPSGRRVVGGQDAWPGKVKTYQVSPGYKYKSFVLDNILWGVLLRRVIQLVCPFYFLQAQPQGRGCLVTHKTDNHYAIVANILADKGKVSRKKNAVLLDFVCYVLKIHFFIE